MYTRRRLWKKEKWQMQSLLVKRHAGDQPLLTAQMTRIAVQECSNTLKRRPRASHIMAHAASKATLPIHNNMYCLPSRSVQTFACAAHLLHCTRSDKHNELTPNFWTVKNVKKDCQKDGARTYV